VPDHSVIARFRRRHAERVQVVFVAVLRLCRVITSELNEVRCRVQFTTV
jgi:hypothetical protein